MNKQHGNKGRKLSAETKRKMAEAKIGNKNAMLYAQKATPIPLHPKLKKLRAANAHALKGKAKSAEHKLKIARSLLGNKNASVDNICPSKLQARQSALKLKQAAEQMLHRAAHANTGRKQSPDTIAKIRAALLGNTNALRAAQLRQQAQHTLAPVQQEQVNTPDAPIDEIEQEFQDMLKQLAKPEKLPLHAAPPKPYDLQETPEECAARQRKNAEEVLGKDFFDGWELTDE